MNRRMRNLNEASLYALTTTLKYESKSSNKLLNVIVQGKLFSNTIPTSFVCFSLYSMIKIETFLLSFEFVWFGIETFNWRLADLLTCRESCNSNPSCLWSIKPFSSVTRRKISIERACQGYYKPGTRRKRTKALRRYFVSDRLS